ncbi:Serine/threonine-protein kinase PrkC [Planctomycetales bacterium 10988]|nr:Serine/threonine-protein kinase PrkC [Planctomycetales bacterium 10988]
MSTQQQKQKISFTEALKRSGLVNLSDLTQIEAELKELTGDSTVQERDLADALERNRLITSWQRELLEDGYWEGFFLDKYRLLKPLGSGGMCCVYLAKHELLQRKVAIKVLKPKGIEKESNLKRFQRESQALATLDHENVVKVFDGGQQNGFHYTVMEYVAGSDLRNLTIDRGPLPIKAVVQLMAQAADGLACLHENQVIHRDIKPANLLVDGQGKLRIADLGLALPVDLANDSPTMENNSLLGTVDYLAPEQARDSHYVTPKVDIYSLGCTFYYLLTGEAPFARGSLTDRLLKHQVDKPARLDHKRSDVPRELAWLCNQMLRKNPELRPTAEEVAELMRHWLQLHDEKVQRQKEAVQAAKRQSSAQPCTTGHGSTVWNKGDTLSLNKPERATKRDLPAISQEETQMKTNDFHVMNAN